MIDMHPWRSARVLLSSFLLASGAITWFSISGGAIFWDPLPFYGTPATYYLLGFSLAVVACTFITTLRSPRTLPAAVMVTGDVVFAVAYIFLLVGPLPVPPAWYPWFQLPVILFGVGICFEIACITALLRDLGLPSASGRTFPIPKMLVAGTLLGLCVHFLEIAGFLWMTNACAYALPALLIVVSVQDGRVSRVGLVMSLPPRTTGGKDKHVFVSFLIALGFGTCPALALLALRFVLFTSFPSIPAHAMAISITIMATVAACLVVIEAVFSVDRWVHLSPKGWLVVDTVLLVVLGASSFLLSLGIDGYFDTLFGSVHVFTAAGFLFYAWWRLGTIMSAPVLPAGDHGPAKSSSSLGLAVVASFSVLLFLLLLVLDIDHGGLDPVVLLAVLLVPYVGLAGSAARPASRPVVAMRGPVARTGDLVGGVAP